MAKTKMVKAVGGDRISVQSLMGPKVDPHSYQVTFKDTAALQKADLVFYSGQHLEGKMQEVLEKRAGCMPLRTRLTRVSC